MDDRTQTPPQHANPQARTRAEHRAAASKARTRDRRRRGRVRVALVGATLFIAVFSLLSYRMYVGLDPMLGDQNQASATVATAVSEGFSEELEDIEDEESAAQAVGDQLPATTTTPQPTTRAS